MIRNHISVAVVWAVLAAQAVSADDLAVETDKENVVSSRLAGNWHLNALVTKRLTGATEIQVGEQQLEFSEIAFKSDPAVARMVPKKFAQYFAIRRAVPHNILDF